MAYPYYCYPYAPHPYQAHANYYYPADPRSQVFSLQLQAQGRYTTGIHFASPMAVTPHSGTTNVTNVLIVNNHSCKRCRCSRNHETVACDLEDGHQTEPFVPPISLARVPTSVSHSSSRRDQRFALTAAPVPSYSGSEFNGQALDPGHHLVPAGPPSLQQVHQSRARYWSDMHTPSNRTPRNYNEGEHAFIEELSSQYDAESLEQPDEESQEAERKAKKDQSFAKKFKSVLGKK